MQTFKGEVSLPFKVVVPQQFLDDLRTMAQSPDATPFLKQVQLNHPENDDAFVGAVLKNAIRHNSRDQLVELFNVSGLGGTVAPATIEVIEVPHDFGGSVQPVVPEKEAA